LKLIKFSQKSSHHFIQTLKFCSRTVLFTTGQRCNR